MWICDKITIVNNVWADIVGVQLNIIDEKILLFDLAPTNDNKGNFYTTKGDIYAVYYGTNNKRPFNNV